MSFLYQPPRTPYKGLEIGLAGNVHCENINTLFNALAAPIATASTTSLAPNAGGLGIQLRATGNVYGAGLGKIIESDTAVSVSNAAPADGGGVGTGMTVKLRYHAPPAVGDKVVPKPWDETGQITAVIADPGIGYKAGDRVSVTNATANTIFARTNSVVEIGSLKADGDTIEHVLTSDEELKCFETKSDNNGAASGFTFVITAHAGNMTELVCTANGADGGVQMQLNSVGWGDQFNGNHNAVGQMQVASPITASASLVVGDSGVPDAKGPWDLTGVVSTTTGSGHNFACNITWDKAATGAVIAIVKITGGVDYREGDTITITHEAIQQKIIDLTPNGANDSLTVITNDLVIKLTAANFQDHWNPSGHTDNTIQIVKIHFPQPSINGDNYDKIDDVYTCNTNVTSGNKHLPINAIAGFVTNALDSSTGENGGKLIISVVRYAPPGFSLSAAALNCRLGKRQLALV